MSVKNDEFNINREHPEYRSRHSTWRTYSDLYAGGEQLRGYADRYLVPRQKEPRDVYAERLQRVFYQNYVGAIADWYAATLFRREPVIEFAGGFRIRTEILRGFHGQLRSARRQPYRILPATLP